MDTRCTPNALPFFGLAFTTVFLAEPTTKANLSLDTARNRRRSLFLSLICTFALFVFFDSSFYWIWHCDTRFSSASSVPFFLPRAAFLSFLSTCFRYHRTAARGWRPPVPPSPFSTSFPSRYPPSSSDPCPSLSTRQPQIEGIGLDWTLDDSLCFEW